MPRSGHKEKETGFPSPLILFGGVIVEIALDIDDGSTLVAGAGPHGLRVRASLYCSLCLVHFCGDGFKPIPDNFVAFLVLRGLSETAHKPIGRYPGSVCDRKEPVGSGIVNPGVLVFVDGAWVERNDLRDLCNRSPARDASHAQPNIDAAETHGCVDAGGQNGMPYFHINPFRGENMPHAVIIKLCQLKS